MKSAVQSASISNITSQAKLAGLSEAESSKLGKILMRTPAADAQREIKLVLALVGRQSFQHC